MQKKKKKKSPLFRSRGRAHHSAPAESRPGLPRPSGWREVLSKEMRNSPILEGDRAAGAQAPPRWPAAPTPSPRLLLLAAPSLGSPARPLASSPGRRAAGPPRRLAAAAGTLTWPGRPLLPLLPPPPALLLPSESGRVGLRRRGNNDPCSCIAENRGGGGGGGASCGRWKRGN